jgi:hypothetical protein
MYLVEGFTTGGWELSEPVNSLHEAEHKAKYMRAIYPAQPSSRVTISFDGQMLKSWRGTVNGEWISVFA